MHTESSRDEEKLIVHRSQYQVLLIQVSPIKTELNGTCSEF